jgi:Kdo2-lipid IVA lauroyltransferase/acyltransferase
MDAIIFYLTVPFLYLLSRLPLWVLYGLSDIFYPVTYYLVAYRKRIVLENLRNSFPDKGDNEIRELARKFYRHFNDLIVEILKLTTISTLNLERRLKFSNPDVLNDYYKQGKSVLVVAAHFNNWEWSLGLSKLSPHQPIAIYKPLNNKYFDSLFRKTRERHGSILIPMRDTARRILKDRQEGRLALYGFVSDQSTIWEETQYWTTFLHQLTPVHLGIEKMALKTGFPVVYVHIRKIKRGYYEIDTLKLFDDVTGLEAHEITEKHVRTLEAYIREKPEQWLWTHRRWKLTPRKLAENNNT